MGGYIWKFDDEEHREIIIETSALLTIVLVLSKEPKIPFAFSAHRVQPNFVRYKQ
jgi:hypothetical protein